MVKKNVSFVSRLFFSNLSLKQTVLKNTFWLALAEGMGKLLSFALSVFVARYLQVRGFGVFSFVFAFSALFAIFADLGLSTLAIREVAKNKKIARKYIDNLLILKLILALATFLLISLVIQFMGKPAEVKSLVYLTALFVVVNSLTTFFQAIFQGFEKMEYLAVSKLVYALTLFFLSLLVIWQNLGIHSLVKVSVYTALINLVLVILLTRKKFTQFRWEIDFRFWDQALKEAWPFGLISLLGLIYFQLNTIQVNLLAGDVETGWYSVAYQFIATLMILFNLFYASLFPTLSKVYQQSKAKFYRFLDFFSQRAILACLAVCLLLFIVSKDLIVLLYGPAYVKSVNILRLLLISTFILYLNAPFSEALRMMNLQKDYAKLLFWGVLLNFLLNFPLIYLWGALGASTATIFSASLISFLMIMRFRKQKMADLQ